MMAAWEQDEFVLDPSRITLYIGQTGYDGDTFKRQQLMDRCGIQINKTSRNSVLFMTNIGTTRSSVAFLVEVLVNIARELDQNISEMSLGEREHFEQAVYRLTEMSLPLFDFSGFHPAFLDHSGREATPEGDVRRAFYLSYDDTNCEYLTGERIDERLGAGVDIVSATYVTPYPPGFPVLVPGQVFSREILQFMRDLDTPEIHGYLPDFGYRVYTEKAIEMLGESAGATAGNGHGATVRAAAPAPQKASKKKSAKRTGFNGDQNVPEVGRTSCSPSSSPATRCRPTQAPNGEGGL
jgi:arginine decarboxylase